MKILVFMFLLLIIFNIFLANNEIKAVDRLNYYFSFIRTRLDDPPGQINFGIDQTKKVADAIENLNSEFIMEMELDPFVMSIDKLRYIFDKLSKDMTSKDTFIMYTHSHGVPRGLLIDTEAYKRMDMVYRWDEFVKAILSLPVQNVIILTMACHSGYLAEAMKANSEKWQGQWASQQRNLMVFTSVYKDQLSWATNFSTAPTAIGHPFTYAVRTALEGAADGIICGVKNGYTTTQELVTYILQTAKEKSRNQFAEPQFVGEYIPDDVLFGSGTIY